MQSTSPNPTLSDVSASDKHCVVRSGQSWFSLPAVAVREITSAPAMVAVPKCHPALVGLCHLRSEFIPVIEVNALLDVDGVDNSGPHPKLLVINGRSVWALLIAEAAAIESLETLVAPESRMDDGSQTPVLGTAMFREQIVRVLDPNGVFQFAQQVLEDQWNRPCPQIRSRNEQRSQR